MKIGTRSVLFGAHQFLIHPWFVAWAWWKLYGFPWDLRLWVCFFVHDLGYWGKPNMDGEEGERHPAVGARIVSRFPGNAPSWSSEHEASWAAFVFFHSRFLAKKFNRPFSMLCVADKLSIVLTPWWLYLPLVNLSGEIHEYMKDTRPGTTGKYVSMNVYSVDQRLWFQNVQRYIQRWVDEHKDGRQDTWTGVK